MEVVEINTKQRKTQLPCYKPLECPCNVKCTKKYVQPSRVKSFAPERVYCPPSKVLEANTTYHLSYLNLDHRKMRSVRSQPIRPTPALDKVEGKFADETTNKLSYKPVGHVPKAKPILPRQRPMIGSGPMECITTVRQDYARKHIDKPEMVIPCGHIRLSGGKLDASTTAKLSYMDPGPTEPVMNFKPIRVYCPPSEPIHHDTTQKLSYQPVDVQEKETCLWQLKPTYKPPDIAMCGRTTYSESFLKNEELCTEKPIKPIGTNILPHGGEFAGKTIYKESYLESCNVERVDPFIPCNSISKPSGRISGDTTNKLSYQPVQSEKRSPILPRRRCMTGDGPMQSETTNRCDFAPKKSIRPDPVVPCNNIRSAETPMEDRTTTRLSYVKPGLMECVQSFKPIVQYTRLPDKIDCETVNKLSYQPWTPIPKETIPWAAKSKYQPPKDPMCADTIYQASYPAPGYYEEICEPSPDVCDCLLSKSECPLTGAQPSNDENNCEV
ncbi:stabilizer of axonemal microtubules 1-like [Hylaeus anthracinus]|uniref:stabilizer of axonemal microtubules 1-like n=1 Tax=Hylaeus anthracinus TaxID=313031 RepID=UPI0023B9E167|nr:stabilizer of axonemal microtubules 1-like [Hylaeus anthracinus]